MKFRDMLALGVAASLAAAPTLALADEAPLTAGGPAAESEGGVLGLGSIVEVGGVLFIVTIAGLVLLNNDDNPSPATHT